jgi:opacity protein-like surface antigen
MANRPSTLAACLLASLYCLPALAEDTSSPAEVDWSGYYVGAAIGTPNGTNTWEVHNLALELVPGKWSGTSVVLSFGRDWQVGRLTYGGLFTLDAGLVAASPNSAFFFTCSNCQTTVEDLKAIKGRVGLAAGASHFFATGGYAQAHVGATNVGGAVPINNDTLDGWTLGVGVERRIGEGLSLALTYDHFDLGALDLSAYVPQTSSDISLDLMQVGLTARW